MVMDSFELRKYYAELTGDSQNAFAMREDGPEGYKFTDRQIMNAIKSIEGDRLSNRPMRSEMMSEYGPRMGGAMGNLRAMNDPILGAQNLREDLDSANEMRLDENYMGMMGELGSAASQMASPNPIKKYTTMKTLMQFLMGR